MFKKIDIWILYLVIFLNFFFSIFLASSFGILVRQELVGKKKLGKISETALLISETPLYLKEIFKNPHRLKKDRFPNKRGFEGYPNSQEAYLLLSRYDGDLKEGVVELIDLRNFKTIYSWNPDIDEMYEEPRTSNQGNILLIRRSLSSGFSEEYVSWQALSYSSDTGNLLGIYNTSGIFFNTKKSERLRNYY